MFNEPLPSNDRGLHIQTHRLMGSGGMIYIPGLIKIGSDILTLIGGGYTDSMEIA
jgi:hypothetical protein